MGNGADFEKGRTAGRAMADGNPDLVIDQVTFGEVSDEYKEGVRVGIEEARAISQPSGA